ncbi:unnamed protein product [Owenia fusiformis]|uniref:Uncharacterized protein n=1 Tax=Owenia fusiformis TaxID=6347 RepID=A0A8J1TFF3_OWEFU|nr:unnamed protein product [Owenia fusiformis]
MKVELVFLILLLFVLTVEGDIKCINAGGNCQTTTCGGVWKSGLCYGAANRRCCIGDVRDSKCKNIGGNCQTTACDGSWRSGLCYGPTNRRCCIDNKDEDKLSHSEAAALLSLAGIGLQSSGGCSNRNVRTCTSLEQIRRATILGTITELKIPSKCPMTVSGGTETGHSRKGVYSHWNGYKIDLRLNDCLAKYIKKNFPFHRLRGRYPVYKAPSGNEYCLEGNHWDNTYY